MTQDLANRKYKLIEEITDINNEGVLIELEEYLVKLRAKRDWHDIVKPIREEISIEELKKEQGYKPISKEEFDKLVEELDIEEPIEELLSMLD